MSRTAGSGTPRPRGRTASTAAGPWGGVVDACQNAASSFADPTAMDGVNALDTAGDAVHALGESFEKVGKLLLDEVYFDPRIAPFIEELGQYILRAEPIIRDGAKAVRGAHGQQIQDIEENDPRKRRWGIAENNR